MAKVILPLLITLGNEAIRYGFRYLRERKQAKRK